MIWFCLLAACLWTLDESRLPPDTPAQELVSVLAREGVEVQLAEAKPLWKGQHTAVFLSEAPFAQHQLRVEISGRSQWSDCTSPELAELYQTVQLARTGLKELTHADGFLVFAKSGKSPNVEIIPCKGPGDGVMDAVEKAALNDYFLYEKKPPRTALSDPQTASALRSYLQTAKPSLPPEKPLEIWTQKLIHANGAKHYCLQALFDELSLSGALVQGTLPAPQPESPAIHELRINPDRCAFCNPSVIQKQLVTEWKDCVILLNHKPNHPQGSFLILPKRHQCSWDLTEQEAVSCFEAFISLQKLFPSSDWIFYVQDGAVAGQTVPHTHLHFYPIPSRTKLAVTSLQHIHNQRNALSETELRTLCAQFEKQLKP